MIDPNAITTYSQYNEDLILHTLLHKVSDGYYVDVGANDPTIDSVTKYFYQKGWRGINIEPVKSLHAKLLKERPRDINLSCGVGEKRGTLSLREYDAMSGHSTFNPQLKKQLGVNVKHKDYDVEIRTLADIFSEHKVKKINFLKIDVEGFEYEVVCGNDWSKYRPQVVCIEVNHLGKNWQLVLNENKYKPFIFDGLNEYFIAEEAWDSTTKDFAERIVLADYHALKQHQKQSWDKDSAELVKLTSMVSRQDTKIKQLEHDLAYRTSLTLKEQPWHIRFKRAIYGLTFDWVKYKYKKNNRV